MIADRSHPGTFWLRFCAMRGSAETTAIFLMSEIWKNELQTNKASVQDAYCCDPVILVS